MIPLPTLTESAAFELDDHISAIRAAQRCEPVIADVIQSRERLLSSLCTLYSRVYDEEDGFYDLALRHLMVAVERRVPAMSVGALDLVTLETIAEQLRSAAERMRMLEKQMRLPVISLKEVGT